MQKGRSTTNDQHVEEPSPGRVGSAIPIFVGQWLGKNKHGQRYPELCFSQSPDARSQNYVVVFSTAQAHLNGVVPAVMKYISSAPVAAGDAANVEYGQMWRYTSSGSLAGASSTESLLHTDSSSALFVRAYNEQGVMVSETKLSDISGWLHTRDKLLERVLDSVRADIRKSDSSLKLLQTSLPVYYVNCDAGGKPLVTEQAQTTTGRTAAPTAGPLQTPAQSVALELWSSPGGADTYIDNTFVGKTPMSLPVAAGEHTIVMRKQNFGTWQRKLRLVAGKRRVGTYLEQKVMELGPTTQAAR
jgi:hypothetical protein